MNDEYEPFEEQFDCQVPSGIGIEAVTRRTLQKLVENRQTETQIGAHYVNAFCTLLLQADDQSCLALVAQLQARGASNDRIADQLIAEAARDLGARWDNDVLSFSQVSLGMSTLLLVNSALRSLSDNAAITNNRQVLFATLSHQAHTLGIALAAEAFRQRGWDTVLQLGASAADILAEVGRAEAELVGFTAGRQSSLEQLLVLARQIQNLPHAPQVIIGGIAAVSGANRPSAIDDITVIHSVEHALQVAEAMVP